MIDKLIEQQETIKGMQENEESAIKIMKMYEDYKLRVDKAIELLKENLQEYFDRNNNIDDACDIDQEDKILFTLLNILKGDEK